MSELYKKLIFNMTDVQTFVC